MTSEFRIAACIASRETRLKLDIEKCFLYIPGMGKVYAGNGWIIKVFGNEHPPMHVHVIHPDGKALIYLDGTVRNRGVPIAVITQAIAWASANHEAIRAEWARLDNPERG